MNTDNEALVLSVIGVHLWPNNVLLRPQKRAHPDAPTSGTQQAEAATSANRWTPSLVLGDEVTVSFAGHVSRAMLSGYSHLRMGRSGALDGIAARHREADEKHKKEVER
jgi:hypothetical protein